MAIELTRNTEVEVFNDGYGVVGYSTDRVRKDFPKDSMKRITLEELEDVMNTLGGRQLFEQGQLLVKDEKVREYFDLAPLGTYNLDKERIKQLLESKDLAKLEEVLKYCSNEVLDKIVREAIEIRINSIPQAGLIRSYSGVDVAAFIEESTPTTQTRTKTDEPTSARVPQARNKIVE